MPLDQHGDLRSHDLPKRLSPAGGVRIAGVDLAQPLSPELKDAIVAAFLTHHIVVFPEQRLTREQQFAFAANFGEVEAHGVHRGENKRYGVAHVMSNLDADGKPAFKFSKAANYHWHTDKPYHPVPPMMTTLYAVELPPFGRRSTIRWCAPIPIPAQNPSISATTRRTSGISPKRRAPLFSPSFSNT